MYMHRGFLYSILTFDIRRSFDIRHFWYARNHDFYRGLSAMWFSQLARVILRGILNFTQLCQSFYVHVSLYHLQFYNFVLISLLGQFKTSQNCSNSHGNRYRVILQFLNFWPDNEYGLITRPKCSVLWGILVRHSVTFKPCLKLVLTLTWLSLSCFLEVMVSTLLW